MTTREQLVEKCKRLVDEYAHHFAVVAQLDDAPHYKPQRKELDDATAAAYAAIEELAASPPSHPDLRAFDAAVSDEMALVSTLHNDSHAVCTLFAANLRERLAASPEAPAPQGVQAGWKAMPQKLTPEMEQRAVDAAREYMERTGGNSVPVIYRALFDAAPPSPPAVQPQLEQLEKSWTLTFNTPSKYIALYMVLNSEHLCAFRAEAVANGIEYTDVVVELDGVATSFALGEFARRLGIGAPSADPAVSPDDGGIEDDLYRLRRYIEGKSIYGRPYALDWLSNIERALARPAVSPDVQELVEAARESLGLQEASLRFAAPSVLYRPALSMDGNQWCALYGANLQDGVAGFGATPEKAMADFDRAWGAQQ